MTALHGQNISECELYTNQLGAPPPRGDGEGAAAPFSSPHLLLLLSLAAAKGTAGQSLVVAGGGEAFSSFRGRLLVRAGAVGRSSARAAGATARCPVRCWPALVWVRRATGAVVVA